MIHSCSHYEYSTGTTSRIKTLDFSYEFGETIRKFPEKIDGRIDPEQLRIRAENLFDFLKYHADRLHDKDRSFADFREQLDKGLLSVLESLGLQEDVIRATLHAHLRKDVEIFDDKVATITTPLGEFYPMLVQVIEDFQEELRSKA